MEKFLLTQQKEPSIIAKKALILYLSILIKNYGEGMEGIPRFENITRADLILSANRALLSEVRSNMRKVSLEYLMDEKKLFYISIMILHPLKKN